MEQRAEQKSSASAGRSTTYGSLLAAADEMLLVLEHASKADDGTADATVVVPCKNAATGSDDDCLLGTIIRPVRDKLRDAPGVDAPMRPGEYLWSHVCAYSSAHR